MSHPALAFRDVLVLRGGRAVVQVDRLDGPAGSLQLVLGANGSGKTSLLLAAAGLLDLGAGRIDLFGEAFHSGRAPAARDQRRRIGVAFQEPYLFAGSVARNVGLGLRLRRVSREEREDRVAGVIGKLGLAHLADSRARALSGGERKLVALAAAVVTGPDLLLLDEPLTGLDDGARTRVLELVSGLVAERGASVWLATHQPDRAEALADGIIRLDGGRLASET